MTNDYYQITNDKSFRDYATARFSRTTSERRGRIVSSNRIAFRLSIVISYLSFVSEAYGVRAT